MAYVISSSPKVELRNVFIVSHDNCPRANLVIDNKLVPKWFQRFIYFVCFVILLVI